MSQAPDPDPLPPIGIVDGADTDTFAAALGPLFEKAPRFMELLAGARPFGSWASLFSHADELALSMPMDAQLELIDAHPRIGAPPASVSALSFQEQGYDQEHARKLADAAAAEADELRHTLTRLNTDYEAVFGFRYVIFVAGRPRSAIVPLMERALHAQADDERRRALHDVVAIARDRATRLGASRPDAPSASEEVTP